MFNVMSPISNLRTAFSCNANIGNIFYLEVISLKSVKIIKYIYMFFQYLTVIHRNTIF